MELFFFFFYSPGNNFVLKRDDISWEMLGVEPCFSHGTLPPYFESDGRFLLGHGLSPTVISSWCSNMWTGGGWWGWWGSQLPSIKCINPPHAANLYHMLLCNKWPLKYAQQPLTCIVIKSTSHSNTRDLKKKKKKLNLSQTQKEKGLCSKSTTIWRSRCHWFWTTVGSWLEELLSFQLRLNEIPNK